MNTVHKYTNKVKPMVCSSQATQRYSNQDCFYTAVRTICIMFITYYNFFLCFHLKLNHNDRH